MAHTVFDYPQIIHFDRIFHDHPAFGGSPIDGNPHQWVPPKVHAARLASRHSFAALRPRDVALGKTSGKHGKLHEKNTYEWAKCIGIIYYTINGGK